MFIRGDEVNQQIPYSPCLAFSSNLDIVMDPVLNDSHVLSDATNSLNNAGQSITSTHHTPKEVHIKRPMNAFILWSREKRKELARENSEMHHSEMSIILGATWKKMTVAERTPYIDQAKRVRLQHMKDHPDYKYNPQRRQRNSNARQETNYVNLNIPRPLGLHAVSMLNRAPISHSLVYHPYYQSVQNAPGAPSTLLPPSSAVSADGNNNYLDANSLHHPYSMTSTAGKPTTLAQVNSNLHVQLTSRHTMETNSLHSQMSPSTSGSTVTNNLQSSSPTSVTTMTSSTLDSD